MSSFLAFRYIVDNDKQFADGLRHLCCPRVPLAEKQSVRSAEEIDTAIRNTFRLISHEKKALLLSGGVDSSILASYMPEGSDAYTFRFMGGSFQSDELHRAELIADRNRLRLHYVDIDWTTVDRHLPAVMRNRQAPVHSIEPQIYQAALQAKADGVTMVVIGDEADYAFGGMDGLYAEDWGFDTFVQRYIYVNPAEVLVNPVSINDFFEPYRLGPKSLNWIKLMDELMVDESRLSYLNAFTAARISYIDPYATLRMSAPLNIDKLRQGQSKYLLRELYTMKYPDLSLPEKLPMPRPVDAYFADWQGPARPEFRKNIDISKYTGNQRWLIWCLERFLNILDDIH